MLQEAQAPAGESKDERRGPADGRDMPGFDVMADEVMGQSAPARASTKTGSAESSVIYYCRR